MTRPAGSTTANGYGYTHAQARAAWAPIVAQGHTPCHELRCLEAEAGRGRTIHPGQTWHLCHNRKTGGYLGPGHARCNQAERNRNNPPQGYMRRRRPQPVTSRVW